MRTRPTSLAFALSLALVAGSHAQDVVDLEDDALRLDTIDIIGRGQVRQVQTIGKQQLEPLPPGTSPLKALEKLPGVSFQSADPFGAYEWSTRIRLRGFDQNRLGFTLDDVPLGDMSYGNHNGLHVSRAVITENLAGAELAQGSGSVATASSGNLGGTVQFRSSDPNTQGGLRFHQTVGSEATRRSYVRVDSGERSGLSAYLSGSFADTDKWKGDGNQRQVQTNSRLVYAWGEQRLSAFFNTSRRREVDYSDFSLESQQRLGWDWDNYQSDWQRAVEAARGNFSGAVNSLDDAYYAGRGLRDDNLSGLRGEFSFGDSLELLATGYHHTNEGQGHWYTPYTASSDQVPISIRTTEYDIERHGVVSSLAWYLGDHRIEAGLWYEDSVHGLYRNFYGITGPVDRVEFLRQPTLRGFQQRFDTRTWQYHLMGELGLLDGALTLSGGFKALDARSDAKTYIGNRAQGRLDSKDNFLPQFGAVYRLSEELEVFAAYAENIAAFRPGVNGPFSATQAAFDATIGDLSPESSRSLEAGLRWGNDDLQASLAAYQVRFDDRLLGIAQCAGIVGCASAFANVGRVDSRGAETTLNWRFDEGLAWFSSLSWNDSEYKDSYLDGTTLIATAGKQVVDSPELLFATELSWTLGRANLRFGGKYTGERYITYLNDSKVPGYWLLDASASWDFGAVGPLGALRLRLNVTNLADKSYFSTVGSNGFVVSDPQGLNYTLQRGAPRQLFLTLESRF